MDSPVGWGFDYTNSIPYREVILPFLKKSVMGMILNYIWWWDSSSGNLESVEYSFIVINPRFTLTQHGSIKVPSMGQIDLFKNYSYSIGLLANNS